MTKDKMKGKTLAAAAAAKNEEHEEVEDHEYGDDDYDHDHDHDNDKKKRRALTHLGRKVSGAAGSTVVKPSCQVEVCTADMADAKPYHRRHKVCEFHAKAPVVFVAGLRQRFCQQCSRFHEVSEFDEAKRSCRRRLLGHNERRRKSSFESNCEGSA